MFRYIPIGSRQAQRPIRPPSAGGPDLGAVEDPVVAVADGRRDSTCHIGAAAGFGQELHPDLLPAQDGRDMARLLFLGSEIQQHRRARRHGRHLETGRIFVAEQFLVERLLVRAGQSLSPVPGRDGDACETGLVELALQATVVGHGRQFHVPVHAAQSGRNLAAVLSEFGPDPFPRACAEVLDGLDLVAHAEILSSTTRFAIRRRCSDGVPCSIRFMVARRRNRCRSCSKVNPMPPCNWTQSWSTSTLC